MSTDRRRWQWWHLHSTIRPHNFCGRIQMYSFMHILIHIYILFCDLNLNYMNKLLSRRPCSWLIDWCLTPALAIFQLYRGVHAVETECEYRRHFSGNYNLQTRNPNKNKQPQPSLFPKLLMEDMNWHVNDKRECIVIVLHISWIRVQRRRQTSRKVGSA